MSAHTPGPWKISPYYTGGLKDPPQGFHIIASKHLIADVGTEADAHLLAAADDMLEALKDALECLEIFTKARWEDWDGSASRESSVGRIRAAIAKAEGLA